MADLADLPSDITPEQFFTEVLPEVLGEIESLPDGLGTERMQFNITGPGGGEYNLGIDPNEGQGIEGLTIEEGQATRPPICVTASVADFQSLLAGDLRDKVRDATGGLLIGPKQLRKAFMPDAKVQKIKTVSGDVQLRLEAGGQATVVTITFGGNPPNTAAPRCKVSLGMPAIMEMAQKKANPQQLFMQGKIRMDGDMSIVLQLMGMLAQP